MTPAAATPSISYAVTACDELEEVQHLVPMLEAHRGAGDEILIQYDTPKTPAAMLRYLDSLNGVTLIPYALNNDFAAFKNHLTSHCRGDYIFQIDADEYPASTLLSRLRPLLAANPHIDVLLVPRINIVSGLTPDHVRRWGWQVNAQGWVNFPDRQTRIWRNHQTIRWQNKVHERLVGAKRLGELPALPDFCLIHPKTIARQERQNRLYETLSRPAPCLIP